MIHDLCNVIKNYILFCRGGVFGIFGLLLIVTLIMVLYPRKEKGEIDTSDSNEVIN